MSKEHLQKKWKWSTGVKKNWQDTTTKTGFDSFCQCVVNTKWTGLHKIQHLYNTWGWNEKSYGRFSAFPLKVKASLYIIFTSILYRTDPGLIFILYWTALYLLIINMLNFLLLLPILHLYPLLSKSPHFVPNFWQKKIECAWVVESCY